MAPPRVLHRSSRRRSPFYLVPSVDGTSHASQNLDGGAVLLCSGRYARPCDDGVRGSPADLLQDFDVVLVRFGDGHQHDRVTDLLRQRGEPRGRVRLFHRDETSVLLPSRAHPESPLPHARECPPQGHHVRAGEDRAQLGGGTSHDRPKGRERSRQRQVLGNLQELNVTTPSARFCRSRSWASASCRRIGPSTVKGTVAKATLASPRIRATRPTRPIPQPPSSPPRPPSITTISRSRSAAEISFSSSVSMFGTAFSSIEA